MTPFSRRQFLQLSGIALGSALLPTQLLPHVPAQRHHTYGRSLGVASVYASASGNDTPIARLWPDSSVLLLGMSCDMYRIPQGYVSREAIQPINPYQSTDAEILAPPFDAEVVTPVTTIRSWASADAPLLTRIGHGGIMRVVDVLSVLTQPRWYAVADENGRQIGWIQAIHWRSVSDEAAEVIPLEIRLNVATQSLAVFHDNDLLLQMAVSTTSTNLARGTFRLENRQLSKTQVVGQQVYYGAPGNLDFGNGIVIGGVYWHNCFGRTTTGSAVQLPYSAARWLYGLAGSKTTLSVS